MLQRRKMAPAKRRRQNRPRIITRTDHHKKAVPPMDKRDGFFDLAGNKKRLIRSLASSRLPHDIPENPRSIAR